MKICSKYNSKNRIVEEISQKAEQKRKDNENRRAKENQRISPGGPIFG